MAVIDTTLDSLTIVQTMSYRGAPEEWSNTYFMDGDLPSSPASWKTLADAVIADQKTVIDTNQNIIRAIGHQAGESVAVWAYDYEAASEEVAGTFTPTAGIQQAGDSAAWVRWSTDAKTSKGKPIYLRSYFHPAYSETGTSTNVVLPLWVTAAQAYGDAWIAGYLDGDGVTHHRGGPHGVIGLVATVSEWVTTRTLERRGKRP